MTSLQPFLDGFSFASELSRVSPPFQHLWRIHSVVGLRRNNFCCIFKHAATEPSVGSAGHPVHNNNASSEQRQDGDIGPLPTVRGDTSRRRCRISGLDGHRHFGRCHVGPRGRGGSSVARHARTRALTAGHPSNWRCPVCRCGYQEPEVWLLQCCRRSGRFEAAQGVYLCWREAPVVPLFKGTMMRPLATGS